MGDVSLHPGWDELVRVSHVFWDRVEDGPDDACWRWTGTRGGGGYGRIRIRGRRMAAHRVAYELAVGPIPYGLQLDHLCRNRLCVNPAHLEPVTNRENSIRGETLPAANLLKTECANGHPYTPENTVRFPSGERKCRECKRQDYARWKAKREATGVR